MELSIHAVAAVLGFASGLLDGRPRDTRRVWLRACRFIGRRGLEFVPVVGVAVRVLETARAARAAVS